MQVENRGRDARHGKDFGDNGQSFRRELGQVVRQQQHASRHGHNRGGTGHFLWSQARTSAQ
jgi:hypothetical protein